MARVNILNKQLFDNTVVTGNGTFRLFESPFYDVANSIDSLEIVISYDNNLPDPEIGGTNYNLTALIETKDAEDNFHPIHYQFAPYVKNEQGNKHVLTLSPNIFNLDEGVPNDIFDGKNIVARESKKQGFLPDDFRVVILINENGFDSTKKFESVELTLSYLTYSTN